MSLIESPKLRVINTHINDELHRPTEDNPEGGIIQAITTEGITLFQADEHVAVEVNSRRPHHPEGSKVVWITKQSQNGCIAAWSEDSWDEVADNKVFLAKTEFYVQKVRRNLPAQRYYFFIGFRPPEKDFSRFPVYPYALQSQNRGHGHLVKPITPHTPHDRLLNEQFDYDPILAALFLNIAGEASIQYYKDPMEGVGTRFEFEQPVGIVGSTILKRTVLGFDGLQPALQAVLRLRRQVKDTWLDHSYVINRQIRHPLFPGFTLDIRQCPVPSFAITIPSIEDRRIGSTDNRDPVWVIPFSVLPVQSLFADGGVIFDHRAAQKTTKEN